MNAAAEVVLEQLMAGFFEAVSFREGSYPCRDRLVRIFASEGRLIRNTSGAPEVSTVSDFITSRETSIITGELLSFSEFEVASSTTVFGNMAHRLSVYRKSALTHSGKIESKGVISTQFSQTRSGWNIISMSWDDERPGLSVPEL
ncbi:hypothetical protein OG985_03605 [Streptomyces sp. NBC_00289]|uniref:hypothetical protein n=1 Tax=Streptomyces sp. NBC_00289 TaxID=2975703 RepID=UPI00324B2B18